MARKNEFDYFKSFIRTAEYSAQAADLLHTTLNNYDPETLVDKLKDMHVIEHAADLAKHELNRSIVKAFITPIEREDIMMLSQELDEVTDKVEDVLLRMYMFNLLSVREDAIEFATVIHQCCQAMMGMMSEFHNFRKSKVIFDHIVEINRLEEEGDTLYTKAMRKLHMTCQNPIELMAWREVYDRMERCCDACEHVANVVESIIMKNS